MIRLNGRREAPAISGVPNGRGPWIQDCGLSFCILDEMRVFCYEY